MPLSPIFILNPLNPSVVEWEGNNIKVFATLRMFGVHTSAAPEGRLLDQYNENKVWLHGSPINVPPPSDMPLPANHSCAMITFKTDATVKDQYLLRFYLKGKYDPKAAFYLNGNLLGHEQISGEEYISFLITCPPPQTLWMAYVFLAGVGILEIKEIECYKL
jgi:hypothetical protein